MEYSSSTQMENQMESGSKKVITKEELNDSYITVANAGYRTMPSVKATISKDSVKEDISPAEVKIPDCQESAKPDKQEAGRSASSCTVVKKEELSDVLGTMVFPPEMSLSTLYCTSSTPEEFETNKMQEEGRAQSSKAHESSVGSFVDISVARVTNKFPDIPASTFTSTSSLKVPIKRDATIQLSPIEIRSNGSTVWTAPARTITSPADIVANEDSIRESGSEDHEDGFSPNDADMKETGIPNQQCVEDNNNEAKSDCDGGQFTCLDCAAAFQTNAAFQEHIAFHEGYRRYKCTLCEQRFTIHGHLLVHRRRHEGERPFKCDVCEKKFTTNSEVTAHKRIHTGERPFGCDICEKKFAKSGHLINHKRTHTGERPFKCDICDMGCVTSSGLTVHKRIHTGEKPFECLTCQKRFTKNGDLQRHTLIHTGERPFKCDICDMGCVTSSGLTVHKRIHTGEKPFECLTCQKRFTKNGDLQRHNLIHTGERPFKCDNCNKKFATSNELKLHKRVHSGEKPYKCLTCGKCFSQSSSLLRHMRTQHADPEDGTPPDVSHLHHSSPQSDANRECSPMEDFINNYKPVTCSKVAELQQNEMEYSSSTQMTNHMESGKKEVVTKEVNDCHSTVSNAGDRRMESVNGEKSKDSLKKEISTTKTDGTEGQQAIHVVKKIASGDTENDSGTMLLPDMPLPTSLGQRSTTEKKDEAKMSEFMDDATVGMPMAPLSNKFPVVSSSSVHSGPPLKLANKAIRLDTIVSNLFKMKNNGSAAVRIESTRSATTASAETGAIEHSIRVSGSEQRDEGCSPDDADVNDIGSSKQHHVGANPIDANNDYDEGQFTCLDCTAVFETNAAFQVHISSHPGYRKFKCTLCEQRFTRSEHIKLHMRRHSGDKPFECDTCEKNFITSGNLIVHKLTHTGERPFECPMCQKCFSHRASLNKHKVIHTGKKQFKCDVCNQCFTQSGSVTIHKRRIHTEERPFECNVCQKKFSTRGQLTKHERIHTGVKPFKCDVCEKCFTESGHLKTHKRIHTGERSFKCDNCDKVFVRSGQLDRHKRLVHFF